MSSSRPRPSDPVVDDPEAGIDLPVARPPGETLFAVLLLLVALVLCWQAWRISGFSSPSSPGAFPMAAAATMVIALLVVVGKAVRGRSAGASPAAGEPADDRAVRAAPPIAPAVVVVFFAFVLGYAVLLDALGFLPASLLFLLLSIGFLHRGSPLFTLVVSLGSLALIYVVFRLVFSVILPEGIVPESQIMAWFGSLFESGEGTR